MSRRQLITSGSKRGTIPPRSKPTPTPPSRAYGQKGENRGPLEDQVQAEIQLDRSSGRGDGDVSVLSELELKHEAQQDLESEQPAAKRYRRKPLELTQDQQDDVADWYREQECLYNKSHYKYKDVDFKTSKWEEKASELGLDDCQSLKIWVESMRSQAGRLLKEHNISGSRKKVVTDRDKWILQKFDFLRPHIYRINARSGQNLLGRRRDIHGAGDTPVSLTSSDEGGDVEQVDPWDAIQLFSQPQEQTQAKMAGSQEDRLLERQQWGDWMNTVLRSIDDRLWNKFRRDSMELMEKYQTDSAKLRKRDQQQVLQQQQVMLSQPSTQQSVHDLSTDYSPSSSRGHLPAWQDMYEMPSQELMYPQATADTINFRVHGQSLVSASQNSIPRDEVRAHSAPPVRTPQTSPVTCEPTLTQSSDFVCIKVETPS